MAFIMDSFTSMTALWNAANANGSNLSVYDITTPGAYDVTGLDEFMTVDFYVFGAGGATSTGNYGGAGALVKIGGIRPQSTDTIQIAVGGANGTSWNGYGYHTSGGAGGYSQDEDEDLSASNGGGASVLLFNNNFLAIAAGGGGAGGRGDDGGFGDGGAGGNAQGLLGATLAAYSGNGAGATGGTTGSYGAGGGGGGGGAQGGAGGASNGGDDQDGAAGGTGGYSFVNYTSPIISSYSVTTPGAFPENTNGNPGANGRVLIVVQRSPHVWFKSNNTWKRFINISTKIDSTRWKPVQYIYTKVAGAWKKVYAQYGLTVTRNPNFFA